MGRKPKQQAVQTENCGTCGCGDPIPPSAMLGDVIRCRYLPTVVTKKPAEWCAQWRPKRDAAPIPAQGGESQGDEIAFD